MSKREKLTYNNQELVQSLQASTGKGVDAFFPATQRATSASDKPASSPSKADKAKANLKEQDTDARTHARKRAPVQARKHTSTRDASTGTSTHARIHASLRKAVLAKRHLSSFTFRFRADELERLDVATDHLNRNKEQPTSKNDVVRLALNWLLADYEEKRSKSVLAQVLGRE